MGSADYLALGDWNVRCDRCGAKFKGSQLRKTWEGYMCCSRCWEPRHPQDFVRAVVEHPTPPYVRNPPDVFLSTPEGIILEESIDSPLGEETDYILTEDGTWIITED